MAEPLARLFSNVRRNRPFRRAQYEPFQGFVGQSSGMRGQINPLDSQAMADTAQGVDIGSIAPPTRLVSDRIDEDLFSQATPLDAGQEGGGERSPFAFAVGKGDEPTQASQTQCPGGVCPTGPRMASPSMLPMQATAPAFPMQAASSMLPPGVTLGPGETFVPGSLREGPPAAALARVAPATTQPAAGQQQAASQDLNAQQFLDRGQQQFDQAMGFAANRQGVQAMIARDAARASNNIGLAAAFMAKKEAISKKKAALIERGFDLQERKLAAETGELRYEMEAKTRMNREAYPMPRSRAEEIVRNRMVDDARAGLQITEERKAELSRLLDNEFGVITAMDAGHFLPGTIAAGRKLAEAKAKGEDTASYAAALTRLEGEIKVRLHDRYSTIADPQERMKRMQFELYPTYEAKLGEFYKSSGQTVDQFQVQREASDMVTNAIADVDEMIGGAGAFDDYYAVVGASRQRQQEESEPVRAQSASRSEPIEMPADPSPKINPWGLTPQPQ